MNLKKKRKFDHCVSHFSLCYYTRIWGRGGGGEREIQGIDRIYYSSVCISSGSRSFNRWRSLF